MQGTTNTDPGTTKDSRAKSGFSAAQAKLTSGKNLNASKLGMLTAAAADPGVIAEVGAGGTIVTAGRVDVAAHEAITFGMFSGQIAAGLVGAGASVAIVDVSSNVRAKLGGGVTAAGAVNVTANGKRVADMLTIGIQAGFVGVGAAVSILNDDSVQGRRGTRQCVHRRCLVDPGQGDQYPGPHIGHLHTAGRGRSCWRELHAHCCG